LNHQGHQGHQEKQNLLFVKHYSQIQKQKQKKALPHVGQDLYNNNRFSDLKDKNRF